MECEQRQWTILIYAGGNNDLAPEMAAAFNRLQRELNGPAADPVSSAADVSVSLQPPFRGIASADMAAASREILGEWH